MERSGATGATILEKLAAQRQRMTKTTYAWSAAGLLVIILLVTNLAIAYARQANAPVALQGTDLGGISAPNFTLTDQHGATVSLAQLHGRPIALTFFDSVCPHTDCSLMAQYVNASAALMTPQERSQVVWLAISLNPWHDTPASAQSFLTSHQVAIPVRYLLGSLPQLAPVWSAYHMQSILESDGIVVHTTGVYVIDQQGRERIFLDEGFDPRTLSGDLHDLLTRSVPIDAKTAVQTDGSISQTRTTPEGVVTLVATPGQYGTYTFTAWLWNSHNAPLDGANVTLSLTMIDMTMKPLRVTLLPDEDIGPGVYRVQDVLSMAGEWAAVVQTQPSGFSQPLTASFHITAKY